MSAMEIKDEVLANEHDEAEKDIDLLSNKDNN
jgi:hypothetical protein